MSYSMKQMFDCIDGQDLDGFLNFLADDAVFRFGNSPSMKGKDIIRAGVMGFYSQIHSLRHEVTGEWINGNVTIIEFDSFYKRHDGVVVGVPCCVVLRFNDQRLIEDYRININLGPVFADAPEPHLIAA
ncbi:Ketosteroid isomerase-related protein [Pseudomonas sp. NFACC02]|nr:Ketosteroid isomerase-related protein [Pseudomonas sp. NFACC02]